MQRFCLRGKGAYTVSMRVDEDVRERAPFFQHNLLDDPRVRGVLELIYLRNGFEKRAGWAMRGNSIVCALTAALALAHTVAPRVCAQPEDAQRQQTEQESTPARSAFKLGGYVEAFYQWNFNDPSNGVTNFRFDNRHNSFTISNVALDASWDDGALIGRLTLQVGHTPSTYYLSEPNVAGASGANASGAELWKYLQQAYGGYRFGVGGGLTVTAGLFLAPIGPESMAVRDNWNWSRSNLFYGLPFYHTGVRVAYALSEAWTLTVAGYNGWNSVVDNNDEKSVSTQVSYTTERFALGALYLGGVERAPGAPEGRAWRHLFDVYATWTATQRLAFIANLNGGFEPNRYGISAWLAGALYGRVQLSELFFFTLRADSFFEHVASDRGGRASAIFWPAPWIVSGTGTLEFRPHERASVRLEYRHDQAGADMFFGGGASTETVSRASQDTLTLGVTTWF